MTKHCCNSVCDSNFCPVCGKQLKHIGDMASLLHHLRTNAAKLKYKYDAAKQSLACTPPERQTNRRKQYLARVEKNFQKWDGWVDIVEKFLATTNDDAGAIDETQRQDD